MKTKFYFLGVIFAFLTTITPVKAQNYDLPFVSFTPVFSTTERNLSKVVLDDGIYELIVDCKSSTGHEARYILDVRIKNDNVTAIYFDNGGSLHNGWNNSDYSWSGGGIMWDTDYYGNIISGHAIIQISYQRGRWQLFTVRL